MNSQEFMRNAGNNYNTSSLAAQAANAAKPPMLPNAGDPMKVNPSSTPKAKPSSTSGSSMGDILAASSLATPLVDAPTAGYTGAAHAPPHVDAPPNPFMPAPGAPNPFGFPYMDPMLMSTMAGKGGMPGMMPGMMPMMPGMMPPGMMPGMMWNMRPMAPMQGGGKSQGKGRDEGKRRRPARKKNGKDNEADEVDESSIVRSQELMEVRASQGKSRLSLQEIMPQVVDFAKDQYGSAFLIKCVEAEPADQAAQIAVLEAMLPQFKILAKDQYGQAVIQKIFEVLPDKKLVADQLDGEVYNLATDQNGCRVIQKALSVLPKDAQIKLSLELQGSSEVDLVVECIKNMHANHVIQKLIEVLPPDAVTFIIESVSRQVDIWAEHMYGCRIIQRMLEHCNTSHQQLKDILDRIIQLVAQKKLVSNPFGNYVVQHMLEHGRLEDKKRILQVVKNSIFEFSTQKCSSNVVEKCFAIASTGEHAESLKDERSALYQAVLQNLPPGYTDYPIGELADDKYANFIVQRMLEYSKDPERQQLVHQLMVLLPRLRNSANGKHICSVLERDFNISFSTPNEQ
jgi:hypothetical protein